MMEKNAKIYVAGHKGMVGSAIVRQLEKQGYTNIVTRTHKELDLTRQDAVEKFFAEAAAAGNPAPDWGTEFRSFTADARNFKDTIIVLSVGPYSAVTAQEAAAALDADAAGAGADAAGAGADAAGAGADAAGAARCATTGEGLTQAAWLEYSHQIRLYHECTHVVCRALYPQAIDAVWDELVADAVGICAAFGGYRPALAKLFLDIGQGGYQGGRLENYVADDADAAKGRPALLDALAARCEQVIDAFGALIAEQAWENPFELIGVLQEQKPALWD